MFFQNSKNTLLSSLKWITGLGTLGLVGYFSITKAMKYYTWYKIETSKKRKKREIENMSSEEYQSQIQELDFENKDEEIQEDENIIKKSFEEEEENNDEIRLQVQKYNDKLLGEFYHKVKDQYPLFVYKINHSDNLNVENETDILIEIEDEEYNKDCDIHTYTPSEKAIITNVSGIGSFIL